MLPSKLLRQLTCAACVVSASAWAQSPTTQTEQSKLLKAPEAVGMLGADLFGDKLNYYNGSLEFVQVGPSSSSNHAEVCIDCHNKIHSKESK